MLFPHVETRRLTLSPLRRSDTATAYGVYFRLGLSGLGMVDDFAAGFERHLAAGFLVRRRTDDEVIGVTTLSEPAPAGHVRTQVNILPGHDDGHALDATLLTVNYAFAMWRHRKVYFHLTGAPLESWGLTAEHGDLFHEEAVLSNFRFLYGRLWDVQVCAISREAWEAHGAVLLSELQK